MDGAPLRLELDDEVLDAQEGVVRRAEVGGAGAGHQALACLGVDQRGGLDLLGEAGISGDRGLRGREVVGEVPLEGLAAGVGADREPAAEQVAGGLGLHAAAAASAWHFGWA